MKIGKFNKLKVSRKTDNGIYLVDEQQNEVLLPNAYTTIFMKEGDFVKVFIHHDSEDRLIATTREPFAKLGEFAFLEIKSIVSFGAFASWGLDKDIFVPKKYMPKDAILEKEYIFHIEFDEKTKRLYANGKWGNAINKEPKYKLGSQVSILVIQSSPLGYNAIINNKEIGLLYKNEIFEDIKIGDKKTAYIKKIRNDGKIDLCLQAIGKDATQNAMDKILEVLRQNDLKMQVSTKSDAEFINKHFKLSKKAFKRAINELISKNVIIMNENEINLNIKS